MKNQISRRAILGVSASAAISGLATDARSLEFEMANGENRFIPDLLTPSIDLFAAETPQFNLVDGTVAVVTSEKQPFILMKGYDPDKWFFAPRWGKLAVNTSGRPAFTVTKKVKNNPDGSRTTVGGQLSLMVELAVQIPNESSKQEWTSLIQTVTQLNPKGTAFNFQPLPLYSGKMSVFGLDTYLIAGQKTKEIPVGASSSIAMVFDLSADGADYFHTLVGTGKASPTVSIIFEFKYDRFVPKCTVQAHGLKQKTYDYFSINAKARASYFGLVNGSAEYSKTRADLRSQDGLDISFLGTPPEGIDQQKLLDSLLDQFIKIEVGNWIDPSKSTPANASDPGGFFGGVSVAMKEEHFSDTAKFDRSISFSKIEQEVHQASFSFEQQISKLIASEHAYLIQDDKKLPLLVAASASDAVRLYAIAASYGTGPDSTAIKFDTIDAKKGGIASVNGVSGGVIQFPAGANPPLSAQITTIVDFDPPLNGYKYTETVPVISSGASFFVQPDRFVQKTSLFFTFTLDVDDPKSKALFQWQFKSPNGPNTVGGALLIIPDPNAASYNVAGYVIKFPFQPADVKPDGTGPNIKYALKGVTGSWKDKKSSGTIELLASSLEIDWDGQRLLTPSAFVTERFL